MIKTTIIGYGEKNVKPIKNYLSRLDENLLHYYPAISWSVWDVTLKTAHLKFMLEHLEEKVFTYHPNIICLNLTSRDTDTASPYFVGLSEYEALLEQLLIRINEHNNRTGLNNCKPVPLIITPPPISEASEKMNLTNNRLAQYVYIMKEVARRMNAVTIDLFEEIKCKIRPEDYLAQEGIGLSQQGADLLYDAVFIELTKLINYQGVLKER